LEHCPPASLHFELLFIKKGKELSSKISKLFQ
jgi:hypothetical protein